MTIMGKQFTKDNLTVTWNPRICIHSKICWHELNEVFTPGSDPWINLDGAEKERIIAQIAKCPSGALKAEVKNTDATQSAPAENATKIVVAPNGPLIVHGNLTVQHAGSETTKNNITAFCRCGASANKPFCDGSHNKVGFKD